MEKQRLRSIQLRSIWTGEAGGSIARIGRHIVTIDSEGDIVRNDVAHDFVKAWCWENDDDIPAQFELSDALGTWDNVLRQFNEEAGR